MEIQKNEIKEWISESVQSAVKAALQGFTTEKEETKEFLSAKEAAAFLGDALPTFYKRVSDREFPTYGGGKRIFVKRSDLINWLSQARTYSKEQLETNIFSKMAEGRRK